MNPLLWIMGFWGRVLLSQRILELVIGTRPYSGLIWWKLFRLNNLGTCGIQDVILLTLPRWMYGRVQYVSLGISTNQLNPPIALVLRPKIPSSNPRRHPNANSNRNPHVHPHVDPPTVELPLIPLRFEPSNNVIFKSGCQIDWYSPIFYFKVRD